VQREGDPWRHENEGDDWPPRRPAQLFDQHPHEELVQQETDDVDEKEAGCADVLLIP
jgi:hypothetical protein